MPASTYFAQNYASIFTYFENVLNKNINRTNDHCTVIRDASIIGASLSEPHTRELGGEISVCVRACLLACLLVCLYPSDFARELEVKCSRGQVRITADSKSRSHRFDTGK